MTRLFPKFAEISNLHFWRNCATRINKIEQNHTIQSTVNNIRKNKEIIIKEKKSLYFFKQRVYIFGKKKNLSP